MKLSAEILKRKLQMSVDISNLPLFEVGEFTVSRSEYTVPVKVLMDHIDELVRMEEQIKISKAALTEALNKTLAIE